MKFLVVCIFTVFCIVAFGIPTTASAAVSSEHNVVRGSDGVLYVSTELNSESEVTTPPTVPNNELSAATPSAKASAAAEIAEPLRSGIHPIQMPSGFFSDLSTLFNQLLRIFFLVATLLTFFFLLKAGFAWITSGGDRGKLEAARSGIIAAVLGLIIVSASYAILTLVIQFLGFDSINDILQTGLTRQQ